MQSLLYDPQANTFGVVTSNGVDIRIG